MSSAQNGLSVATAVTCRLFRLCSRDRLDIDCDCINHYYTHMKCRPGCGACCIEPSIAEAIPGMPDGKPGGVRCVNLDENNQCRIWERPGYPQACRNFTPTPEFCGETNEEAMRLIAAFEKATIPDKV